MEQYARVLVKHVVITGGWEYEELRERQSLVIDALSSLPQ